MPVSSADTTIGELGHADAVVGERDVDRADDDDDAVDELGLQRDRDRRRDAVDRQLAGRRTSTAAPVAAASPSSTGAVSTNVAVGKSPVSSAL